MSEPVQHYRGRDDADPGADGSDVHEALAAINQRLANGDAKFIELVTEQTAQRKRLRGVRLAQKMQSGEIAAMRGEVQQTKIAVEKMSRMFEEWQAIQGFKKVGGWIVAAIVGIGGFVAVLQKWVTFKMP